MHIGFVSTRSRAYERRLIILDGTPVLHRPRSFEARRCFFIILECLLLIYPGCGLLLELPLSFFDVQELKFMRRLGHCVLQVLLGRLRGITAD